MTKMNPIVSVVEADKTAPTLSSAVLRRNLLDHDSPTKTVPVHLKRCIKRGVYRAQKDITKKRSCYFSSGHPQPSR